MKQKNNIRYRCPSCNKELLFPVAEGEVPTKWELLAHAIYTAFINDGRKCCACESNQHEGRNKHGK